MFVRSLLSTTITTILVIIIALVALATPTAQAQPTANLTIVHGAAFAEGAAPVTVVIDGSPLSNDFRYKDTITAPPLAAGAHTIQVYSGGAASGTPLVEQSVNLSGGASYTAVVAGGSNSYPAELLLFTDDPTPPGSASGKLRVIHAAPFASPITATAVDVVDEEGNSVGLDNLQYKAASSYLSLPSGTEFDLKVVPHSQPAAEPILDLAPFTLSPGQILTVIVVGDEQNQQASIVTVGANARLRIAHLAPFATGNATVSVLINDEPLPNSLNYLETTDYLDLPAGTYNIKIDVPETAPGAIVVDTSVTLATDKSYTAVVIGGANSAPVQVVLLEDDTRSLPEGKGRLRIYHAAPFATDAAAKQIDVRTQTGDLLNGLDNLGYATNTVVELDAATYDLKVTDANGTTTLLDPLPFKLNSGDTVTLFVVGGANDQPLRTFALGAQSYQVFLALLGS